MAGRGRPKIAPESRSTTRFTIVLTEKERDRLFEIAKYQCKTASSLVKELLRDLFVQEA